MLYPWFLSVTCHPNHAFKEANFLVAFESQKFMGLFIKIIFSGLSSVRASNMERVTTSAFPERVPGASMNDSFKHGASQAPLEERV